jgi:hypothetical protein
MLHSMQLNLLLDPLNSWFSRSVGHFLVITGLHSRFVLRIPEIDLLFAFLTDLDRLRLCFFAISLLFLFIASLLEFILRSSGKEDGGTATASSTSNSSLNGSFSFLSESCRWMNCPVLFPTSS